MTFISISEHVNTALGSALVCSMVGLVVLEIGCVYLGSGKLEQRCDTTLVTRSVNPLHDNRIRQGSRSRPQDGSMYTLNRPARAKVYSYSPHASS